VARIKQEPAQSHDHCQAMKITAAFVSLLLSLGGCAMPVAPAEPPSAARPLDTLPSNYDPALVRADLLATARDRNGAAALDRAMAASDHLLVKRFAGMAPPPPPDAGADWRPPTPSAMLIRDGGQWLVATPSGWRPAVPDAAAQIDALITSSRFWNEPAYTPPCPDFGASNLLLKVRGRPESVRNGLCSSAAADLVQAALGA
jgi:hypothetical protein